MILVNKLPDVEEVKNEYPLTKEQENNRGVFIKQIRDILSGIDKRKILIIGPCSADREDTVVDYMVRLSRVREDVKDTIFIIPRVYTSKPRTNGIGYKGLLHNPDTNDAHEDLISGVLASRKMHLNVIQETGMYAADEMLYPDSLMYFDDLLSYLAVGARSVEDQMHREMASGFNIPVGLKNPTSGDLSVLLNAIFAAQHSQRMLYHGWEVATKGNLYAHAILRGYIDRNGKMYSNYHYEDLNDFHDQYIKLNLKNSSVIVDCSHCNSGKKYYEQERILEEVLSVCSRKRGISSLVKGFMVESYLEEGNQMVGSGIYGKSITDGCIGWDKTQELIYKMADTLA